MQDRALDPKIRTWSRLGLAFRFSAQMKCSDNLTSVGAYPSRHFDRRKICSCFRLQHFVVVYGLLKIDVHSSVLSKKVTEYEKRVA
ncbi:hypothetical protein T4E_8244 [Trichinella pseudospiralis]|uniref:Uncharacterized protein n=1 Tax=Trichinella pseudospiralis TaxID=6337 RepID=A0A0V0Y2Z7_TRIPS|nr:hypothetical protein T4E_8244 [Trichinella pseudospiralis]